MKMPHQGDVLKVEGIRPPVLVCSKDFFNESRQILVCPLLEPTVPGPLHISVQTEKGQSLMAHCEKLTLLDLAVRGWKKNDRLSLFQIMDICDAIQSIFDYL